jgi:hypothetical protein
MHLERYSLKGNQCAPFIDTQDPFEDGSLVWRVGEAMRSIDVRPHAQETLFFATLLADADELILNPDKRLPYASFSKKALLMLDGLSVNAKQLNEWIVFLSNNRVHTYISYDLQRIPHSVTFATRAPDSRLYVPRTPLPVLVT